jgi:transposase
MKVPFSITSVENQLPESQSGIRDGASQSVGREKYKSVSNDSRAIVLRAIQQGKSIQEVSTLTGINPSTIRSIRSIHEKTGRSTRGKQGGSRERSKISLDQKEGRCNGLDEDCSLTGQQIKQRLYRTFDVQVSVSTILKVPKEYQYSFKRTSIQPERRNCPETLEKRIRYDHIVNFRYANQLIELIPYRERFIFLDETGFQLSIRKKSGWSPEGTKAVTVVRSLRTTNYSLAAAMSQSGIAHYNCLNVAYNKMRFEEFVISLTIKLGMFNYLMF